MSDQGTNQGGFGPDGGPPTFEQTTPPATDNLPPPPPPATQSLDVAATAPPPPPPQPVPPTGQFILTIGEIGVTPDTVVTPNGEGPLAGSQWIVTDMSTTESKIPSWAIVMAILFAFLCLVGLFFLLVKEKVTKGYVEVSVRTGSTYHKTQIPVSAEEQVAQIRQLVNQAQSLAAQAAQA